MFGSNLFQFRIIGYKVLFKEKNRVELLAFTDFIKRSKNITFRPGPWPYMKLTWPRAPHP